MDATLSRRASITVTKHEFLLKYLLDASANAYDAVSNPKGIVNMGTVENKTCEDIWLKKLEEVAPLIADISSLYYFNPPGMDSFRRNICEFLTRKLELRDQLDAEKTVLLGGVTASLNAMASAIADEGETILCPTPCYGRILNDIEELAGARFYKVPMFKEDSDDALEFQITALEDYYSRAKEEGLAVKGVILCNPQNPTGKVYSKEDISRLLSFCASKGIHAIIDEIYALTCYDEPKFHSVLSCDIPDPHRTHFLWGFSKDFGLSGFRCGVVYSSNTRLLEYLRKISIFCIVPAPVQIMLNAIISDTEWLDNVYFPVQQKELREHFDLASRTLARLGIPIYRGTAGGFIWVNLSKYLPEKTFEAEIALFYKFLEGGLYICPGKEMFSPYPGWFRLTFTTYREHVKEGLCRMEKVLSTC